MQIFHHTKNVPSSDRAVGPWALAQQSMGRVHDGQCRCAVYFRGALELERLARSILLSFQAVPPLGCRFVPDEKQPHWQEIQVEMPSLLTTVTTNCTDDEVQSFLRGTTSAARGPQIRFRLVRGQAKDTLCVIVNRMVCDDAGLKEYLYLLGRIYTEIQSPGFHPPGAVQADLESMWRRLPPLTRFHIRRERQLPISVSDWQPVPFSGAGEVPFIVSSTLPVSRCRAIAQYAVLHHARFSDVLLAAYVRALAAMSAGRPHGRLSILCEADLRRFLPWGDDHAVCALSLPMLIQTVAVPGTALAQTLQQVRACMHPFQTLTGVIAHSESLGIMPLAAGKTEQRPEPPVFPPLFFNDFGKLDASRLVFGQVEVNDVFLSGPIFRQPHLGLHASVYEDSLTLSCGLFGTRDDWAGCKYFLAMLVRELPREE